MSSALSNPLYNPPMEPYVSVLYRDDDIVVLDKPSGLLSVPGRDPALSDSLATRVQKQFPKALMINRLDKDTSGIVLMSLNRKAHAAIASQFENRTTKKSYNAVVWGEVTEDTGLIDLPLAIDPDNKPRHRVDHETGRASQTEWQVLDRLPLPATRLRLHPLTGRTHQLRVHMKAIGHPILGDVFYADGDALKAADRLLLHAEELSFRHPDGRDVTFNIPCPF
ncbi:pseudouridine synthase [Agrobacterium rubi]|uniref:Dual-specificity RNA pseudouridine synthase RluA n=2 Tax=Agrobacterium rubi TaxID=28099 RepID=A0AAE7REF3_9HYPH|nr:pseudouridine synthase [Agrobacterium rubi]MBP1878802.1 tRNA pseudouridine32 synthase/23S rRNA pseudouridine746 synthase [Agrobacterium rubi]MCL6652839.1 RNA pseudouridine synthase [Agrobacterium rubi]NTE88577.1 RNA pseudouridine synthase [Agrobacterium rubi]NTF04405.1 RNA pseudouridine synthase [Agrobacterium rubi]NTF09938.1 RNA pseudouridine synthase [Agrobacterium rubi]